MGVRGYKSANLDIPLDTGSVPMRQGPQCVGLRVRRVKTELELGCDGGLKVKLVGRGVN